MTLVEEISALGSGDHVGFGGDFTGGYHLQQNPEEFAELIEALQGRTIRNYLQVGSAAGGTERFLCEKLGIQAMTIIDLGEHPQFHVWREVNRPALEAKGVVVHEYLGDSHEEGAEEFVAGLPKFDLIGIDGDHTPAGVRMDWQLITPLLRPGSLVWFHDTNAAYMRTRDNGPWEVCQKLKERHKLVMETARKFGITLFEVI